METNLVPRQSKVPLANLFQQVASRGCMKGQSHIPHQAASRERRPAAEQSRRDHLASRLQRSPLNLLTTVRCQLGRFDVMAPTAGEIFFDSGLNFRPRDAKPDSNLLDSGSSR